MVNSRVCIIILKNVGVVLYSKWFTKNKRISAIVDISFFYLHKTFALAIVHHVLKSMGLVWSRLIASTSQISRWIDMFVYKLAAS